MIKDFVFGVGTSSLQIEESGEHDWKGLQAKDGSVLDRNAEHLKHWKEDYSLIKDLGVNAYRCSVDWSKLQSSPYSELETKAVEKYQEMFQYLKENKIDLFLVLHHFANPLWFTEKKGWKNKESIDVFKDFSVKATEAFKDYTNTIITMNEPMTDISLRYMTGFAPPKKKNAFFTGLVKAHGNMDEAHKQTYRAIKNEYPNKQVSFTEIQRPIEYHNNTFQEKAIAKMMEYITNERSRKNMMEYEKHPFADFIGMQYYGPYSFNPKNPEDPLKYREDMKHDDLWEIDPHRIPLIAKKLKQRYNLPVYIMEHGVCTDEDSLRQKQIVETLNTIKLANKEEDIIKGYFHWSLLDNFELDKGTTYRFGLVNVDFNTMQRTPKTSYHTYKEMIKK